MDILNWLYLRKQQLIKKTVNNATTDLVVLGADATFAKRDDKYKTYAMTVEDFATAVALPPAYKSFTALLTQSGESDIVSINSGNLTIGVTYAFDAMDITQWDFTNVGGPKYPDTTSFIATGTTPNAWGSDWVYNTGAPVATILENTIGNVWFAYEGEGSYNLNSNNLLTTNKTSFFITNPANSNVLDYDNAYLQGFQLTNNTDSFIQIISFYGSNATDGFLNNTPIEIRVYN
jgi:hypothetical protein